MKRLIIRVNDLLSLILYKGTCRLQMKQSGGLFQYCKFVLFVVGVKISTAQNAPLLRQI